MATRSTQPIPEGHYTVTPVLTLEGAQKALDWYKKALGAETLSVNLTPDGKVAHAEIQVGNSRVMLNDPMADAKSARQLGGSPVALWLYLEDCDRAFERAKAAGGKVNMPIADQFWGDRVGSVIDPFGIQWTFATHKEDVSEKEMNRRMEEFFSHAAETAGRHA
jgi:PhnB protein